MFSPYFPWLISHFRQKFQGTLSFDHKITFWCLNGLSLNDLRAMSNFDQVIIKLALGSNLIFSSLSEAIMRVRQFKMILALTLHLHINCIPQVQSILLFTLNSSDTLRIYLLMSLVINLLLTFYLFQEINFMENKDFSSLLKVL